MDTIESEIRAALPVFTTHKMMEKSESLLNPAGRQSNLPANIVADPGFDKPLTNTLYKDIKQQT